MIIHTLKQTTLFSLFSLAFVACQMAAPKPEIEMLPLIMPVTPYETEFVIRGSSEEVYEQIIQLSQKLNLNAVTLDPNSGLMRFEQQSLSPNDLDLYCRFPVIDVNSQSPLSNFQTWNQQLLEQGAASAMRGEVTLTFLISQEHIERTRISLRSNWMAVFALQKQPCNSRGVFELRVEKALKRQ